MSEKKSKIIVPLDFSEQSLIALGQSFNLARLTDSELILLNVIDQDFFSHLTESILSKYDYADHLNDEIQKRLDDISQRIREEQKLEVKTMIRTGKIYSDIVDVAREENASLIIMGTNGATSLKKKFLGSNASRVIKEAHCPVITIKGKHHREGCKSIVLPLDLTKETKEKVDKAIELANLFNSIVHIVTIVNTTDEFLVNKLTRQLNQVKDFMEDSGIRCTTELIEGDDIPTGIIEYSKKMDADLIMIMTQQELIWTDLFIGSAAQEVINNSDIPVLSITPVAKKDTTEFVIN